MKVSLTTQIGTLSLNNPVLPASGCYDWQPLEGIPLQPGEFGAVVLKSVTLSPRDGNPPPRIIETIGGMLNAIGIPSDGIEAFRIGLLKKWSHVTVPLIASISAFSPEEYGKLAAILDQESSIAGLEVNLSCPNLEHHTLPAQDAVLLQECLRAVREATGKTVIAKLSPNVTDIVKLAVACEAAQADAVCLINTLRGMVIDIHQQKPVLGNKTGGLSGPAIKPVAMAMVYEVCQAVKLPVIGVGGITCAQDALEFFLAGASAIQVGSGLFRDPLLPGKIVAGLEAYLLKYGYGSIQEIIGLAQTKPIG